jgi:A/G-specific adenine glycosylase
MNWPQLLINWFQGNQRDLPWRKDYESYQVWISEVMLQQTQVATVLPYFERWMARFPTIESLASASEDEVLKHWEGLGYYSRARNLHKMAQKITEIPTDKKELLSLPGIGPYTAGAILSIAFNQDEALVDGNVIRVLSRLTNDSENSRLNTQRFWKLAEEALPHGQARAFNQGLMELGALICSPKSPKCSVCPIAEACKAKAAGTAEALPNRGPKQVKEQIQVAIAIIEDGDKVFIQKRPSKGLMGGLWEFPGGKVEDNESVESALHREIQEEMGIELSKIREFKQIKHAYTRFKVDLHCYLATYERGTVKLTTATEGKWVKRSELKEYAFPAANVNLIEALLTD